MRQTHPFLRGLVLAAVFALMMSLLGTPALMEKASFTALDGPLLAFGGMAAAGAFVAAIPGRLKRLHGPWRHSSVRECLLAFVGGLLVMLGLQVAQVGDLALLCGVLQGGLGALALLGCAWLTAAIAAGVMGRWTR